MSSSIQAHILIEELEKRPVTNVTFPSHFNVAIELRNAISQPGVSTRQLAAIVRKEPLVAARVVKAANTVGITSGTSIFDIEKAIHRIGMDSVKRIVLGVTMVQLARSKEMISFASLSRLVWLHSLYCASASSVIAEAETSFNPNEMFFSGLLLNIGAFYLLYQAATNKVLRENVDDVIHSVKKYHIKRSVEILKFLSVPEETINTINILERRESPFHSSLPDRKDVLIVANELASQKYPWIEAYGSSEFLTDYADYQEDIEAVFNKTRSEFS